MKKFTLLIVIAALASGVMAQTITFEPVAGGDAIDSILVTNLADSGQVVLGPGEPLVLGDATSFREAMIVNDYGTIYPNPFDQKSTLSFSTQRDNEVVLSIYNVAGAEILRQNYKLAQGEHRFEFSLPNAGLYFITAFTGDANLSYKAIYTGEQKESAEIQYLGTQLTRKELGAVSKSTAANLPFDEGDILHYECYSGNNTTMIGDSPTESKTVQVEFWACEIEGEYYKVVKMGDQVWMAENVRYLPFVSAPDDVSETEARYYVYNNQSTDLEAVKASDNYRIYGTLLNHAAANALAPRGWHLPTDQDFEALVAFVNTDQGTTEMGGHLLKSSYYWIPEGFGSGDDPYAFTLLPGGRAQTSDGGYCCATGYAFLWSATDISPSEGHKYWVTQLTSLLDNSGAPLGSGHSVRYMLNQ